MTTLPLEIENIILNYKNELEHKEKFKKSLDFIEKIYYYDTTSEEYEYYERIYYLENKEVTYSISTTKDDNDSTLWITKLKDGNNTQIQIDNYHYLQWDDEYYGMDVE